MGFFKLGLPKLGMVEDNQDSAIGKAMLEDIAGDGEELEGDSKNLLCFVTKEDLLL